MLKKKILFTGLTGFIGKHTARRICQDYTITALVRPTKDESKFSEFENILDIVHLDISDREALVSFADTHSFDFILHIGALRGGRKFDRNEYINTNVVATEILMNNAIKNKTKFIFCSTVGVYGTIPEEVPATMTTAYKEDNIYHKTKIQCEIMIKKAVSDGVLDACIVRPAITYGIDDFGFPYTLTLLVDKKILFMPNKQIYINLLNVDTLTEVFTKLLKSEFPTGKIWNVADKEKVCFQELVETIHQRLQSKKKEHNYLNNNSKNTYPRKNYISKSIFEILIKVTKLFKHELWCSRFELISNSWYFETNTIYDDLHIKSSETIRDFMIVVDWYIFKRLSC